MVVEEKKRIGIIPTLISRCCFFPGAGLISPLTCGTSTPPPPVTAAPPSSASPAHSASSENNHAPMATPQTDAVDSAAAAAADGGGGVSNGGSPSSHSSVGRGVMSMSAAEQIFSASGVRFSGHTLDKATKAKVTLENYYTNLISQHKERKERLQRLEDSLREDDSISEEQKVRRKKWFFF